MQRTSNNSQSPMPLLIGLVAIILIGCAVYAVMAFQKAYTVDPKEVFTEYFSNKLDRIQNLTGGGSVGGYFDKWIYFESPDVIRLKSEEWVQDHDNLHRMATWWTDNHAAQSDGIMDTSNLQAWKIYRHPNRIDIFNAEYIMHTRKNRYWLRIWGKD